jgi:hypothetical protein
MINKALCEQYERDDIKVISVIGDVVMVFMEGEVTIIKVSKVILPHSKLQVKCSGELGDLIRLMNLKDFGKDRKVLIGDDDEYIVVGGALYKMEYITAFSVNTSPDIALGGAFIC